MIQPSTYLITFIPIGLLMAALFVVSRRSMPPAEKFFLMGSLFLAIMLVPFVTGFWEENAQEVAQSSPRDPDDPTVQSFRSFTPYLMLAFAAFMGFQAYRFRAGSSQPHGRWIGRAVLAAVFLMMATIEFARA